MVRVAVATILSAGLLAAALPSPQSVSQCNTGNTACCNTVQSSNDTNVNELLGLLGIVLPSIGAQIGLGCTPLSIVGILGGVNCAAQPVCCNSVSFGGLINVGCSPLLL